MEIFAVSVAGFAVLDNHLHLLVRLDPALAAGWSDEDVVRRWGRLFPPRDQARLTKLRRGPLLGRFFAATRQQLRQVGERLGLRRVANLSGYPAS
jgi:hypothetical protein